ncbi:MAG: prolipoprotein diacylglyceryl transferase [Candidatus Andersenbacteria bacterium]|nr:prolipoprotein diacylglyceryl transferase [Candidatus Andersenbacteria bacterium]
MLEFFPSREVAFEIGNLSVRWYGLLYVLAFWLGWCFLPGLAAARNIKLTRDDVSRITAWVVFGVIVGGRLGYVLLYEPLYYLAHPVEVFLFTQGGMSSHGGFIGVALALWWLTRKPMVHLRGVPWAEIFLALADILVVPVAFGLALGRVGNFINQELYPGYWALVVAGADAALGLLCWYLLVGSKNHVTPPGWKVGYVAGVFLVGYGVIRFLNEFVRIDEWSRVLGLTYGQFLTVPVFLLGVWLIWQNNRRLREWHIG